MVSIIMPSLNVVSYIRQCMDSVISQTLQEIEIICVDAGSTDGTLEILEEYAEKDSRISIINSDKKSYGYQMNLGMDAAKGRYMGIVETDDYIDPDMFYSLFSCAEKDSLDVVKSGFFYYYSKPEDRNIRSPITSYVLSQEVFCPRVYFDSPMEQAEFYNIKPTIWSAIYNLDFLRKEGIRFNETPGASFQDCSFNFKVFSLAKYVRLVEDCYYHYRQDNENSSINSSGKMYCVSDEYTEIEKFLNERPMLMEPMAGIMCRLKYDSYIWNYERLSEPLQREFIKFASEDFARDMSSGYCNKKYFPWYKWNTLKWIIKEPEEYHKYRIALSKKETFNEAEFAALNESEKLFDKLKRGTKKILTYLQIFGLRVTIKKALRKIRKKMEK